MRTILAALLISVFALPAGAYAQVQIPARIVREAVERDTFAARLPQAPQQQPARRSWRQRHPVLFGGLVGLGAGLVIEAIVIPGESGGEPHSVYMPMFGTIGFGAGALVGYIASHH
jgi:hypothetical protein